MVRVLDIELETPEGGLEDPLWRAILGEGERCDAIRKLIVGERLKDKRMKWKEGLPEDKIPMARTLKLLERTVSGLAKTGKVFVEDRFLFSLSGTRCEKTFDQISKYDELYKITARWWNYFVQLNLDSPSGREGLSKHQYVTMLKAILISLIPSNYYPPFLTVFGLQINIDDLALKDWSSDNKHGSILLQDFASGLFHVALMWCPSRNPSNAGGGKKAVLEKRDFLEKLLDVVQLAQPDNAASNRVKKKPAVKIEEVPTNSICFLAPLLAKKRPKTRPIFPLRRWYVPSANMGATHDRIDSSTFPSLKKIYEIVGASQDITVARSLRTVKSPAPSGPPLYVVSSVYLSPNSVPRTVHLRWPPKLAVIWNSLPYTYIPEAYSLTVKGATLEPHNDIISNRKLQTVFESKKYKPAVLVLTERE